MVTYARLDGPEIASARRVEWSGASKRGCARDAMARSVRWLRTLSRPLWLPLPLRISVSVAGEISIYMRSDELETDNVAPWGNKERQAAAAGCHIRPRTSTSVLSEPSGQHRSLHHPHHRSCGSRNGCRMMPFAPQQFFAGYHTLTLCTAGLAYLCDGALCATDLPPVHSHPSTAFQRIPPWPGTLPWRHAACSVQTSGRRLPSARVPSRRIRLPF